MTSRETVLSYFQERFGIQPDIFTNYEIYTGSKGRLYLGPKTSIPRPEPASVGILIARIDKSIKPSTNFLQLFGKNVKKNKILLDKEDALLYANGENIEVEEVGGVTGGYTLVSYLDLPLGCGFLKDKTILNMIPKAKRIKLKFI